MGKNKSASGLTNFVQYDNQGNIFFVSGSTTLMSISSSGAITTTGVISGSNALSSSFAVSSSFALTGTTAATASSVGTLNQNVVITGSLTTTGQIVAQTLNVQQVTSSVVYSSGSNIFGNQLTDRQQMTGSLLVTGSGTFSSTVDGTIINSTSNAFRLNGNNALSLVTLNGQSVVKINAAGFWGTQLVGANDKGILIDNAGYVGIGTTSPSTPLHLSGSITTMARITSTYSLTSGYADGFQMLFSNQTGGGVSLNIGKAESTNNLAKIVYFHSADGSTSNRIGLGFYANDALFNILASGNVGIGTTNPQRFLDSRGTANLSTTTPTVGSTSGAYADIHLRTYSPYPTAQAKIVVVDFYTDFYSTYTDGFRWFNWDSAGTTPVERVRIGSNGVLNAFYTLNVNGAGESFIIDSNPSNTGSRRTLTVQGGVFAASGDSSSKLIIFQSNNGTELGSVQRNGGANVLYNTSSDRRLKEDYKDFNGLDLIKNIKAYNFKWKGGDYRNYGVIADELQEVIPSIVSGTKDEKDENGKDKYMAVDYGQLTPILIKAIQELKAEFDEYKATHP